MDTHQLQPSFNEQTSAHPYYYTKEARGPLLDRVFSMRYRSYSAEGYIPKCPTKIFMDEYDEQSNARSLLLYRGNGQDPSKEKAMASARLCHYDPLVGDSVPALEMYRDEIETKLGKDASFVEVNRFVVDTQYQTKGGLQARFRLFETIVDYSLELGVDAILIAVRPEHVRFYKMLSCVPASIAKPYHIVDFSTVLCMCTDIRGAKEFISSKLYGNRHESAPRYHAN